MLVLSRRPGQQVKISDNIVLTVIDVIGNKVRLGFEAPRDVPIFRTELLGDKKDAPAAEGAQQT